ncbi:MAG: methylenetetrahydrofolate reductase [Deltaproteobacteria bacterium]|jgi:methylenetetrahydrofolate reductase (NADPH)|nr:methylenetetrahydrofolate reductase [Deltaproteobacteria bacterium]
MTREIKTESRLEKVLASGKFAATGELGPPRSADKHEVIEKVKHLLGNVDSVNITDNQTAVVRMSSLAAGLLAQQQGLEVNMQMVCRDRNRIAIESDIMGAYALGIKNLLTLSGDHQKFGDHPQAKNVFDIDSIHLIQTIKMMRDDGKLLSGQEIPPEGRPKIFIGAAFNPFADPEDYRVHRVAKKVAAGVDFLQSQCIYDMDRFRRFMKKAVDMGLTEKAYFMAGVTPLKNIGMAKYMKNFVPGITVPDECVNRIKGVPKDKQADEGLKMACEQIEEFKQMEGVAGVHLMLIEWEHMVPTIVKMANLIPRPTFS